MTLSCIQLPHHLSFLLSEMVCVSSIIVMVFGPMLFWRDSGIRAAMGWVELRWFDACVSLCKLHLKPRELLARTENLCVASK